ncbi:MAG TPA: hypothetical protein ENN69_00100 [Spirochaetia bacterium]|nr:hypothetical protein [Spirochaetia bacterium]
MALKMYRWGIMGVIILMAIGCSLGGNDGLAAASGGPLPVITEDPSAPPAADLGAPSAGVRIYREERYGSSLSDLNYYYTYLYSSAGLFVREKHYDAAGNRIYLINYGYDSANRLNYIGNFNGALVRQSYSNLYWYNGRLTYRFNYDATGSLTSFDIFSYNSSGKLTAKTHYSSSGSVVSTTTYEYNTYGRLSRMRLDQSSGTYDYRYYYYSDGRLYAMTVVGPRVDYIYYYEYSSGTEVHGYVYNSTGTVEQNILYKYTSGDGNYDPLDPLSVFTL